MQDIRPCSVDQFFAHPNAAALLAEYGAESRIHGLPAPTPHPDTYRLIEQSGAMHVFAALDGEALIGFIVLLISFNPHYSARIGVVESFFVTNEHRKTGAGLRLLRAAEARAFEIGATGLLVSAPAGGRLEHVMSRQPYRQTNSVFFRGLQ